MSSEPSGLKNPYKDLYIYYFEGCGDVSELKSNPDFVGNWEEEGFTFLFFSTSADSAAKKWGTVHPNVKLLDQFYMTYDQWHGGQVTAFCVDDFLIHPPWEDWENCPVKKSGMHRIVMDPGVVFGTGTHATTHDCLKAMGLAFKAEMPTRLLDIGTGTGILALAAGCLGCPQTIAVDLNALSVQTTRQNIALNGLEDKVCAVEGTAEKFMDDPADFVIANIHHDVMKNLLNCEGFYKKKRFILSGLLKSEARSVQAQLRTNGSEIMRTWDQNGIWFTFYGKTDCM